MVAAAETVGQALVADTAGREQAACEARDGTLRVSDDSQGVAKSEHNGSLNYPGDYGLVRGRARGKSTH